MPFSLGQRCNVNTNEIEPCLLTSPLQGEGERKSRVCVCVCVCLCVCVCVCVPYYTIPLETILAAKHNVSIDIDYMNCTLQVMIYDIEFEAVLLFVL